LTDAATSGLTGRRWLTTGEAYVQIVILVIGAAAGFWFVTHPDDLPRVLPAVPWLVAAAAALKWSVAAWAFREALGRGLVGGRAVAATLVGWLAMAGCAVGLAALLLPTGPLPVPRGAILLGVAAFPPLGRFALAPLALDWNRHR
jgi:hypothetical protein